MGDVLGLVLAIVGVILAFDSDSWVGLVGILLAGSGLVLTIFANSGALPKLEKWATPLAFAGLVTAIVGFLATAYSLP